MPITRKEEQILLAIAILKDDAYLVGIKDYLEKITVKNVSLTSVHLPLSRLETRGFIISEFGESTAVRGGRRKKIYSLSKEGLAALEEYKRISDSLWKEYINSAT
ncbi:PadR family transcriptional regulator [candidate division KSB1 bacterium]